MCRATKLPYCLFALSLGFFTAVWSSAWAKELHVCADPDYMPFSNRAGEGFENKIAELTAKTLGARLVYTWASNRGFGGFGEFLSRNLDAGKCDAVMDMPYGSQEELTTDPYYVSSYVFIYKKTRSYDLENMDSPILRKVKIGFERDTPPEDGLKIRDLLSQAEAFSVGDTENVSPASMPGGARRQSRRDDHLGARGRLVPAQLSGSGRDACAQRADDWGGGTVSVFNVDGGT
jgi:hypothetical protein